MNWSVNAGSEASLPRPSVSSGVSIDSAATVLSSFSRTVTVTSPPKPCTVWETGSADFAPPPDTISLMASSAALEVKVAPVTASMPSSP